MTLLAENRYLYGRITNQKALMQNDLIDIKLLNNDAEVRFTVSPNAEFSNGSQKSHIAKEINDIDEALAASKLTIDEINKDIDRLTSHADGFDNIIAVSSGIITGLIDAFFVGEFNLAEAKADSHKYVNKFIEKYANLRGYEGKGLSGAISFLEDKFPVEQDNVWKDTRISSTKLHHLEDLAHHPTLLGLGAAIFVKFFRAAVFVDKDGDWHLLKVDTDSKTLLKIWLPVIITGMLNWLIYIAESKYADKMDEEIPKPIQKLMKLLAQAPAVIEVLKVTDNWLGHLVSDMGGSKNTAGGGMGIPGIFLSLLKEISSIPGINKTDLPKIVSDLYSKSKFDMRAELAVVEHLGKQAVPVIINECIVRSFYFVRHLVAEKKEHSEWKDVNWNNILPWGNRTINRMMTIASGTFMAVDMADAAIRSGVKSGGEPAAFLANFVLRVNFVGVGRFAIAIYSDVRMGCKLQRQRNERIRLQTQILYLCNAKLYYKQAEMWIEAKDAGMAVEEMEKAADAAVSYYVETIKEIGQNTRKMSSYKEGIEKNNSDLLESISNILKL